MRKDDFVFHVGSKMNLMGVVVLGFVPLVETASVKERRVLCALSLTSSHLLNRIASFIPSVPFHHLHQTTIA